MSLSKSALLENTHALSKREVFVRSPFRLCCQRIQFETHGVILDRCLVASTPAILDYQYFCSLLALDGLLALRLVLRIMLEYQACIGVAGQVDTSCGMVR